MQLAAHQKIKIWNFARFSELSRAFSNFRALFPDCENVSSRVQDGVIDMS
jgi:hypothetical protein